MWQFLACFGVVLLAGFSAIILCMRKRAQRTQKNKTGHFDQLEELSKLTGELAHEIKNPLSTIKINLKLVSEDLKDAQLAQAGKRDAESSDQRLGRALRKIGVIEREADRLEQILDGFLRYADRAELQLADADVNELMSDMIDFYSPQAYSHSITIRQGLCSEPLVCRIDADTLKQVVLNLFINAQQAMKDGGELIIRTARQSAQAVIQISDTGSGIAADKLAHIFDAYYSSRPQGSGLGLPTAKRIVEAHNGSLNVNSELGKGTSFTIKLPLKA